MSFTTQNVSNCSNRTFERDLFDADGNIRIPFYAIIFLLSVMGNSLVILTLFQNRRMRTITNVFLLNLSISDLLLAVFCMPFTLIPLLLRNFIFGEFMCIAIRYLQGKSNLKVMKKQFLNGIQTFHLYQAFENKFCCICSNCCSSNISILVVLGGKGAGVVRGPLFWN